MTEIERVELDVGQSIEIVVKGHDLIIRLTLGRGGVQTSTLESASKSKLNVEIKNIHVTKDGKGPYPNDVVVEMAKVYLRYSYEGVERGYKKLEIYRREPSQKGKYYAYTIRGYSKKINALKAKDIHGDPEGNLYVLLEERRKPYSDDKIRNLIENIGCTTRDIVEINGKRYLKLPLKYSPLVIDGTENTSLIDLLVRVWLTLYEI